MWNENSAQDCFRRTGPPGAQQPATWDGARGAGAAAREEGSTPPWAAARCCRAALRVCAAGQPSSPEALTVIVSPPGFTISVLDVDSRFTIVTWTVVLAPADSERTPRLMA